MNKVIQGGSSRHRLMRNGTIPYHQEEGRDVGVGRVKFDVGGHRRVGAEGSFDNDVAY